VIAGTDSAVSIALPTAGAVSGRITDADGHPLADVRVLVSDSTSTDYVDPDSYDDSYSDDGPQAEVTTDAHGSYTIRGVRPGNRTVCVETDAAVDTAGPTSPTGYLPQCRGAAPGSTTGGTPVTVTAGDTTTDVDLQLTKSAGITGTVTNSVTHRAVADAAVIVFDAKGRTAAVEPTDRAGHYLIDLLPAGTYKVCFDADLYAPQCYNDVPWPATDVKDAAPPQAATPVITTAGAVQGGVDAALKRA
jgi:hypothetical protein